MRYFIDAQIDLGGDTPRFNVQFVIIAPDKETARKLAREYLTDNGDEGWYAKHYAYDAPSATVTVHDMTVERLTAEQIARRMLVNRFYLHKAVPNA
jgi:hypothetical protein